MSDFVQLQTTLDREEDARRIAREVVRRRLAACAQILGPIVSVYRWEEREEESEEWLLLMKTTRDSCAGLEDAVRDLHSYDVPEIIVLPITEGYGAYLDWVREETS
jgi:periplasmic divalent cation tolerance protein